MYAKFYPNDANPDESTITFFNIPKSIILDMYNRGYIKASGTRYYTFSPVDYHRDYVAGEGPS